MDPLSASVCVCGEKEKDVKRELNGTHSPFFYDVFESISVSVFFEALPVSQRQ